MLLIILMVNKLLEHFKKKNCKKLINKNLEQKKYLKEKVINYMSNGKVIIIHLIVGLIKKTWCDSIVRVLKTLVALQRVKMSKFFPKSFRGFGRNINVQLDLSNYATKSDIKNISHVDTSSFVLKTNLANLKTEADKLGINKLVPVPVYLSILSDVVKNDVVKKNRIC